LLASHPSLPPEAQPWETERVDRRTPWRFAVISRAEPSAPVGRAHPCVHGSTPSKHRSTRSASLHQAAQSLPIVRNQAALRAGAASVQGRQPAALTAVWPPSPGRRDRSCRTGPRMRRRSSEREGAAMSQAERFGVYSETGRLRRVLVCAPGRAHERLTPSNCDDLPFDDVMWVEVAKRDHLDFVARWRDLGVEVLEMHALLAETVADPRARDWILDRQVVPNQVGVELMDELRSYLEGLSPRDLAETLIGGLSTEEFPEARGGDTLRLIRDAAGVAEYLLPP